MKRQKVVIFSPSLKAVSGVSTHAKMLLGSSLAKDYDLLHFQVGSEGRKESGLQKLMRFAFSPLALARFILVHRPDIVHLNTSMDHKAYWRDLAYLFVAKLLKVKVVNQVHGGPMPQEFFANSATLTWLLRRALQASDAVSVLSSREYQAYSAFCPKALVTHIPNAIDPTELLGEITAPAADQPLRLIYIGRLIREKGLFDVLQAMAQLRQSGHRLFLDIAGSGPAEAELRADISKLGLQDVVHFHGPVFGPEKARLWREMHVLAFPTYHPEGLPYALLEAMAAGTPVITCPVAAIPDVMEDGVHGFFVPPRNANMIAGAIAALDNDRVLLERMARACRARILEKFTVERLANDFREVYGAVLARR